MAIFRECKHSFQIVQALFGKSASTVVCSALGRVFSSKGTISMLMGWYRYRPRIARILRIYIPSRSMPNSFSRNALVSMASPNIFTPNF